VFGKGGAAVVVLIDVVKTVAPVIIGGFLFSRFLHADYFVNVGFFDLSLFGSEFAGFFVMMGHCFPLFYQFKGGKGVMAMGTLIFFVDWRIALIAWGVFILVTLLTRYVSLGAMLGVTAYPVVQCLMGLGGLWELIFAMLSAALLIFRHKENLKRLIKGNESKFSFKRKKEA
jgi:glycerol-3-phosphate acyltransferase PlsY